MRNHHKHLTKLWFTCILCHLTFPTQNVLKNHTQRSHKNLQDLKLSHCESDLNLDELDVNLSWLSPPTLYVN